MKLSARTTSLLLALVVVLPMVATSAAADAAASPPDIEVLGELEVPPRWLEPDEERYSAAVGTVPVHVDREKEILYQLVNRNRPVNGSVYIAEWDLSAPVPRPVRISESSVVSNFGNQSTNAVQVDEDRGVMFAATGQKPDGAWRSVIDVIDLERLERTATWDMTTTLPGFLIGGITYDQSADVMYVVGDFGGSYFIDDLARELGVRPVSPGPAVVALDGVTGAVRWVRPLDGCNSVLKPSVAAFIGLSQLRPVLYTFCDGGGAVFNTAAVGQNTLVRVHIDPDATAAEAAAFPIDVFPVSGNYVAGLLSGVAGFDPVSERFVAQSIAPRTPGGWVFDGRSSAWVGFVAAPGTSGRFLGFDVTNGRYYLAGGNSGTDGYINVTDVRSTPIAQGSLTRTPHVKKNILVGAPGQLFVPVWKQNPGVDPEEASLTTAYKTTLLMQDNSEPIEPLPPLALDELTVDLPDEQVRRDVTASAAGYGARYTLVGGLEGAYSRATLTDLSQFDPSGAARGDRGVTLAQVPRLDLRSGGASASAAAASIDQATGSDLSDTSREVEGDTDDEERVLRFPYDAQTCLDAGGGNVEHEQEEPPGRARVSCDLEKSTAAASTAYGEAASAGGVDVARATFDTDATDDAEAGATSTATAVAEGIAVRLPDGQRLAVDRVTTVATVAADGRPGTTTAEWTRSVEGVSLVDVDGNSTALGGCTATVTAEDDPTGQGECDALSQAITEAVGSRVQVLFPLPAATATPGGAFAEVSKSDELLLNDRTVNNEDDRAIPGMRVIVFSDTAEKSRLLVNLASVDLTATVIRSETFTPLPDTSGAGGTAQDTSGGTTADTTGAATGTTQTDPSTGETGSSSAVNLPAAGGDAAPANEGAASPEVADEAAGDQQVVAAPAGPSTWLVGTRSLGDAATAAGVWLLFAWPLFVGLRRRDLLSTA